MAPSPAPPNAYSHALRSSGLTRAQHAKKMNVSPSYISKVLNGQAPPTVDFRTTFAGPLNRSRVAVAALPIGPMDEPSRDADLKFSRQLFQQLAATPALDSKKPIELSAPKQADKSLESYDNEPAL